MIPSNRLQGMGFLSGPSDALLSALFRRNNGARKFFCRAIAPLDWLRMPKNVVSWEDISEMIRRCDSRESFLLQFSWHWTIQFTINFPHIEINSNTSTWGNNKKNTPFWCTPSLSTPGCNELISVLVDNDGEFGGSTSCTRSKDQKALQNGVWKTLYYTKLRGSLFVAVQGRVVSPVTKGPSLF